MSFGDLRAGEAAARGRRQPRVALCAFAELIYGARCTPPLKSGEKFNDAILTKAVVS